jgi:uncharacterized membrane protein
VFGNDAESERKLRPVFERYFAAHARWYMSHKRAAWAINVLVLVAACIYLGVLFGVVVAVGFGAVVVGLTLALRAGARRRVADQ